MSLAVFLCIPLLVRASLFRPENNGLDFQNLGSLPIPYNLTESVVKRLDGLGSSFWSSSFLHASDGHEYVVLSHLIENLASNLSTMYRGSILDLTDKSRYAQFEFLTDDTDIYTDDGYLDGTFPEYGFASVEPQGRDAVLRTWSSVPGVEFDLSFHLSSPALLNGGLGFFDVSNNTVHEWSMPAGKTTGWLSLNQTRVTVDTEKSLTWFDRQWNGAPADWTWFELHISSGRPGGPVTPMSIWTYDTPSGLGGLATIRESAGIQKVVPVKSIQPSSRTWTSSASGVTYALDWTLRLIDGTTFYISSVRGDQELHAPGGIVPTYEGYVTVKAEGAYGCTGYGVVEIFPPQ